MQEQGAQFWNRGAEAQTAAAVVCCAAAAESAVAALGWAVRILIRAGVRRRQQLTKDKGLSDSFFSYSCNSFSSGGRAV